MKLPYRKRLFDIPRHWQGFSSIFFGAPFELTGFAIRQLGIAKKKLLLRYCSCLTGFPPKCVGSVMLESRFNDGLGNWPRRQVGPGKSSAKLFPRCSKHLIF